MGARTNVALYFGLARNERANRDTTPDHTGPSNSILTHRAAQSLRSSIQLDVLVYWNQGIAGKLPNRRVGELGNAA